MKPRSDRRRRSCPGTRLENSAVRHINFTSVALLVVMFLNLQEFLLPDGGVSLVVSGSNYSLVMAGVLASTIFRRMNSGEKVWRNFFLVLLALGASAVVYGFLMRPLGGISKNNGTPSWTMICAGISLVVFALLIVAITRLFEKMKITLKV